MILTIHPTQAVFFTRTYVLQYIFPIILGNNISSANRKHVPLAAAHNEHYVMTISIEVGLSVNTQKVSTLKVSSKGYRATESHGFIYISGNVTVMPLVSGSASVYLCACITFKLFDLPAQLLWSGFTFWFYKQIRMDSSITQFGDAPLAFGKLNHLTATRCESTPLDSLRIHILSGC